MKNTLVFLFLVASATLLVVGVAEAVNRSRRGFGLSSLGTRTVGMTSSQRHWYALQGFPNPTYNRWTTGYQNFHGFGKYKVHRDGLPWDQALNVCAREGSILAVIDDFEEANIIKNLINTPTSVCNVCTLHTWHTYYYWIGAKEFGTNMHFLTLHGNTLGSPGYLNWATTNSQPDNYGNEDCVLIMNDGTNFDGDCSLPFGFVCEKVT